MSSPGPAVVTVGQLLPKWQHLVVLKDTDTVEDAIEALRDKHLGSVPVTDAKGHYIGYVGALDLLAGLVKSFPQNGNKTPAEARLKEQLEQDEFQAFWQEANFRMTSLKDAKVIDLSERNPWVTLPASSYLDTAVGLFEKGIARLAITDGLKVVGILSQLDVVRFLNADASRGLGPEATRSVKELGFLKPVKAVLASASMIVAIMAMAREGVRSLAVVDHHWKLVGHLSPSDIMAVLPSIKFADLHRPVADYLPRLHDLVWYSKPVLRMHETDTLSAVLHKLIACGVHHGWVVDAHEVPVGIVTLTDVLQIFVRHLDAVSLNKFLTPHDTAVMAKHAEATHRQQEMAERRANWKSSVSRKMLGGHEVQQQLAIYLGKTDPKPASVVDITVAP